MERKETKRRKIDTNTISSINTKVYVQEVSYSLSPSHTCFENETRNAKRRQLLQDNDAIINVIRGLQKEVGNTDSVFAYVIILSFSTQRKILDSHPFPRSQTQVLARNLEMIIRIADIQNLLSGEDHKKKESEAQDTTTSNVNKVTKKQRLQRALRRVGVKPLKGLKINLIKK
mgnify:CR=1 FL=1